MEFIVEQVQPHEIQNQELSDLLHEVYVDAGYCTPEEAKTIFAPEAVKQRGILFSARETTSNNLAGFVIAVPFNSPASKLANEGEIEMHLLGVREQYRGLGLSKRLVQSTLDFSMKKQFKKMILWTQEPMKAAQHLYEKKGFTQESSFEKNGRLFFLYGKALIDMKNKIKA